MHPSAKQPGWRSIETVLVFVLMCGSAARADDAKQAASQPTSTPERTSRGGMSASRTGDPIVVVVLSGVRGTGAMTTGSTSPWRASLCNLLSTKMPCRGWAALG